MSHNICAASFTFSDQQLQFIFSIEIICPIAIVPYPRLSLRRSLHYQTVYNLFSSFYLVASWPMGSNDFPKAKMPQLQPGGSFRWALSPLLGLTAVVSPSFGPRFHVGQRNTFIPRRLSSQLARIKIPAFSSDVTIVIHMISSNIFTTRSSAVDTF